MGDMVQGMKDRLESGAWERTWAIANAVDEAGRAMDAKWGVGRLPTLVGAEMAAKFARAQHSFSRAVRNYDADLAETYGAALERGYLALDRVAQEAGHEPKPPEQWEFTVDGALIVLVRDRGQMSQVQLHGRKAQVWSVDELAEVIRNHEMLAEAKNHFPGAEVESIRPVRAIKQELNDSLAGLPF